VIAGGRVRVSESGHGQITVRGAVIWYVAALLAAQAAAPATYSWVHHTVSELGAQGYDRAWIMRLGLVGFGLLINGGLLRKAAARRRLAGPDLCVMVYGAGILLSGVISTAPFVAGMPFSATQASWHSVFATSAGLALSAGMLWRALIETTWAARRRHLAALVAVTLLSALFGMADSGLITAGRGVIQRGLHVVGLAWLWVAYGLPMPRASRL